MRCGIYACWLYYIGELGVYFISTHSLEVVVSCHIIMVCLKAAAWLERSRTWGAATHLLPPPLRFELRDPKNLENYGLMKQHWALTPWSEIRVYIGIKKVINPTLFRFWTAAVGQRWNLAFGKFILDLRWVTLIEGFARIFFVFLYRNMANMFAGGQIVIFGRV